MNNKAWSVLFGTVMLACAALFVVAPIVGWWLPRAASFHAADIDHLWYLILAITGFFFIVTEAILVGFMYRYAGAEVGQVPAARGPSLTWKLLAPMTKFINSAHRVEMAWTLIPAVILLWLAFAQVDTWAMVKYKSRLDRALAEVKYTPPTEQGKREALPLQVEVSARQFEWRMRYPSPATWREWKREWDKDPKLAEKLAEKWVKNPQFDDVRLPNELHLIQDRYVVVQLSTKDVIHSFNSAHMRVKQDALPGKLIPVWFKPIDYNCEPLKDADGRIIRDKDGKVGRWGYRGGHDPDTDQAKDPTMIWEIACAELCGWGHYRMVGRIYVHATEEDFLEWLEHLSNERARPSLELGLRRGQREIHATKHAHRPTPRTPTSRAAGREATALSSAGPAP